MKRRDPIKNTQNKNETLKATVARVSYPFFSSARARAILLSAHDCVRCGGGGRTTAFTAKIVSKSTSRKKKRKTSIAPLLVRLAQMRWFACMRDTLSNAPQKKRFDIFLKFYSKYVRRSFGLPFNSSVVNRLVRLCCEVAQRKPKTNTFSRRARVQ